MKAHNWMMTHWKPASAFVYTLICFCDFVIFPSYVGINRIDLTELIGQIRGMDPSLQIQIVRAATSGYEPFTLRGSGLFHLAFGALLTGAAIRNGNDTQGLMYGRNGAEWKRRQSDVDDENRGGHQPKKGSDPGSPPTED